jgi:hypothetical protein
MGCWPTKIARMISGERYERRIASMLSSRPARSVLGKSVVPFGLGVVTLPRPGAANLTTPAFGPETDVTRVRPFFAFVPEAVISALIGAAFAGRAPSQNFSRRLGSLPNRGRTGNWSFSTQTAKSCRFSKPRSFPGNTAAHRNARRRFTPARSGPACRQMRGSSGARMIVAKGGRVRTSSPPWGEG